MPLHFPRLAPAPLSISLSLVSVYLCLSLIFLLSLFFLSLPLYINICVVRLLVFSVALCRSMVLCVRACFIFDCVCVVKCFVSFPVPLPLSLSLPISPSPCLLMRVHACVFSFNVCICACVGCSPRQRVHVLHRTGRPIGSLRIGFAKNGGDESQRRGRGSGGTEEGARLRSGGDNGDGRPCPHRSDSAAGFVWFGLV